MIFVIFAKALPEWFYKSYYHCFTTIKFPKPSWRTPQSMIPSIANPTKFVEKYRTVRVYSPWRFLPPRNTPDLFCRRFTRQNHRCAVWAVFFFFTNKILCSCSIFQNLFLWLHNCKVLFLCLKEAGCSVRAHELSAESRRNGWWTVWQPSSNNPAAPNWL